MEALWSILGFFLLLFGLIGSVLPVIPGPPIAFGGMLLIHFLSKHEFSWQVLIAFGILTLLITILDFYLPIWSTRKFGGSKAGQWGATIGVLLGLLIGPWGVVFGPLVGAYVGELVVGRNNQEAWRSAKGAFLGFLLGTGLKLMLVGAMLWFALSLF